MCVGEIAYHEYRHQENQHPFTTQCASAYPLLSIPFGLPCLVSLVALWNSIEELFAFVVDVSLCSAIP